MFETVIRLDRVVVTRTRVGFRLCGRGGVRKTGQLEASTLVRRLLLGDVAPSDVEYEVVDDR